VIQQNFERKRERFLMLTIDTAFILVLVAIVLLFVTGAECDTGDADAVDGYISQFLKSTPNRRAQALKLTPVIVAESRAVRIDPLLVAVIISLESSFRHDVKGDIGEVGMMQVVPGGVCARGHDLTTPAGQIKAGVHCLKLSRDVCGNDLTRILTMYASGRCVSKSKRTHRMINHRIAVYGRAKDDK
jgi:hypothetical protein